MPPKLELRDLRKEFDGVAAVQGISLALEAGEFVSLLGPSGCGKSTTLAMVAGFLAPDGGDILIDDRSVLRLPPQSRRIGLVFQDYAVFTKLKVRDNLAFGLEVKKLPRAEKRARLAEIADRLNLQAILDRRGAGLNMSEMQRVALARVLVTEPQLLLLDEPMSNLDAAVRAGLRGELKLIQRQLGQTVLYVTHDQVEAMGMSDRIAVMREGRVLQMGSPDDIYRRPIHRFVAEFIGDPPINMIAAEIRRDGLHLTALTPGGIRIALGQGRLDPGEHIIGVRPHDVAALREPRPESVPAMVRFVENLGAEHVLHVEHGSELVRVVTPPGFAAIGDTIHLAIDPERVHLIEGRSGDVVPLLRLGAVA